jgi:integrase
MTLLEQVIADSRRLAPKTKAAYLASIRLFLAYVGTGVGKYVVVDARTLKPADLDRWCKAQAATCTAVTINSRLAAVKTASKRLHELHGLPDFAASVEGFKGTHGAAMAQQSAKTPARALSTDEVNAMYGVCAEGTWMGMRDRAILCLGFRLGLRRMEIAQVEWRHFEDGIKKLRVAGKGDKDDILDVDDMTQGALRAFRAKTPPALKTTGFVFVRARNQLIDIQRPLTPDGINKIVSVIAAKAKVPCHPHEMRHTFISQALAAGVPPWMVQKAARHASPLTTYGYAHMPANDGAIGNSIPTDSNGEEE